MTCTAGIYFSGVAGHSEVKAKVRPVEEGVSRDMKMEVTHVAPAVSLSKTA
jgi:hypothetical protein